MRRIVRRHRTLPTNGEVLHQVLREEQIERPIQRNPQLLLKSRQLAEVDRSPEEPGDEAGEFEAQDLCDACATADRGERAERPEIELSLLAATNDGFDVARH